MTINEFIEKVEGVAYATYDVSDQKIYVYSKASDKALDDDFLSLEPAQLGMDSVETWKNADGLSDADLFYILDLVRELRRTPFTERGLPEKKYTIRIAPNFQSYVIKDSACGGVFFDGLDEYPPTETHFTKQEIEQLKRSSELAIDWYKAKIEPMEDDE